MRLPVTADPQRAMRSYMRCIHTASFVGCKASGPAVKRLLINMFAPSVVAIKALGRAGASFGIPELAFKGLLLDPNVRRSLFTMGPSTAPKVFAHYVKKTSPD